MERRLTVLAFVEAAALVALVALWLASTEETDPSGRLGVPAGTSSSPGSSEHDAGVRDSDAANAGGEVPAIATSPFTPPPEEVVAWPAEGPLGVVLWGRIDSSLEGSRGAGAHGWGWAAPDCSLDDAQGRRIARVRDEGEGYAIPGLAPGRYTAKFWARHHHDEQRELEITGAENPVRCDVRLVRKEMIRIRVLTPEGAALPAFPYSLRDRIRVLISPGRFSGDRVPPEFELRQPRTLGRFLWKEDVGDFVPDLGDQHFGIVELGLDPPLWLTLVVDRVILGAQLVASDADEVTFVIAPRALDRSGDLRLRVVEAETGKPLERFGLGIGDYWHDVDSAARLDDGSVVLPGIAEGSHRGLIGSRGRETRLLAFDMRPGEETDLGVIKLRAGRALSGRIEDAEGRPRSGPVRAIPRDAPDAAELRWTSVSAASDGTFVVRDLAPVRFRIVAWSEGLAASWATADASESDVTGVVIRLTAVGTKVTLRAKTESDGSLDAILRDGQGPLWRGPVGSRRGVVLWLAPGSYSVDAALPGTPSRSRPLVVGAQEMVMEIEP